ncbi:MAG: DUF975 family protein [Ruminococcus sp.]
MMKKEKIIKKQARIAISKDNWPTLLVSLSVAFMVLFCVIFIYQSLIYGFNTVNTYTGEFKKSKYILGNVFRIFYVLSLMGVSPVLNGFVKICCDVAKHSNGNVRDLFFYFKNPRRYFTAVFLNALQLLIMGLIFGACLIPSAALFLAADYFEIVAIFIYAAAVILAIAGVLAALLILSRFVFSYYIFAEDENQGALTCISKAIRLSKGHTIDITKLLLSFIPWIALCFFILPVFYVIPYMTVSIGNSAKWLILLKEEAKAQQC